ncbi:MAG: hypothetical protein U1F77_05125 [Kiritimatiellia bacterium]
MAAGLSTHASLITYSSATYASNAADWLTGTPVLAVNFGGATTTYGGETFIGTTDNGHNPGETYASNGTLAAYHSTPGIAWANVATSTFDPVGGTALLHDGTWRSATSQVDVIGLTVGTAYEVQFVLADSRSGIGVEGRAVQLFGLGGNAGQNSGVHTYAFSDGRFTVVTAAFTADATTLGIEPRVSDGGSGSQINALRVVAVPEPGTAGLTGLSLLILRRLRGAKAIFQKGRIPS